MSRILLLVALSSWAGATLLLSQLRWFARASLTRRLRPYAVQRTRHSGQVSDPEGGLSLQSVRDVLSPLASDAGERLAHLFGVREELGVRLERLHADEDVAAFRLRQAVWAAAALAAALIVMVAIAAPPLLALFTILGAPLLTFLVLEQRLSNASSRRQQRVLAELPVIAEQLGMLLGAGYSLGSAVARLAHRGNGAAAEDLARVGNRIRQGLSDSEALLEWARISGLREVERLVAVLSLHRQGADLGRLVGTEARTLRREEQRRTMELLEQRIQLVWVPVTLATLVPGVMFMAVPFLAALRAFATL